MAISVVAVVVTAAAAHSSSGRVTAAGPIPGVSGDPARFETLTGQKSLVDQAFLAWGQGQTFGSPFPSLFAAFGPTPMIHLGTAGRNGKEAITPGAIAAGRGDAYLLDLNQTIGTWGKGIYVRPMAEMNNPGNLYAGYMLSGRPRDAAHSPASYRKAFARIYVILHGGTVASVNAKLRALGLPPLAAAGTVASNPFPRLRIVWSPLAGGRPNVPGNAPAMYYPGTAYVDVDGADIYDEALTDDAPWAELEALYRLALSHHKPFSLPEWGLIGVDDPAFIKHVCKFLSTHRATEMQAYFEGHPGSVLDLASKPKSKAMYRQCLTPLAGPMPAWAS
jgi:hypothetical protein